MDGFWFQHYSWERGMQLDGDGNTQNVSSRIYNTNPETGKSDTEPYPPRSQEGNRFIQADFRFEKNQSSSQEEYELSSAKQGLVSNYENFSKLP